MVMTSLAQFTTLGVGGPAREVHAPVTEAELIDVVRGADLRGTPLLVIGGGSNLLIGDTGFDGVVVRPQVRGVSIVEERDAVTVTAGCGEPWDDLVSLCVERGWSGIDALSGIPGLVGATPIQNVGAYGQEVSQCIANVRVWDRDERTVRDLSPAECGFSYRDSVFKHQPDRWVVLAASFRLAPTPWTVVAYAQLAEALSINVGDVASSAAVRDAVLRLRRAKGMVLDPNDVDTASAGSFFVNPVIATTAAAALASDCPRYPSASGVKVSAAWLIEQAGITRGWQLRPESRARVSTKHTLALTNTGGASAHDLIELARAIRVRVQAQFGIELQAEPRLVGCEL